MLPRVQYFTEPKTNPNQDVEARLRFLGSISSVYNHTHALTECKMRL